MSDPENVRFGGNVMILTVDIGNSNIVLGGVDGEKIVFEDRLRT